MLFLRFLQRVSAELLEKPGGCRVFGEKNWSQKFSKMDPSLPHGSNLNTKLEIFSSMGSKERNALNIICEDYFKFLEICLKSHTDIDNWIEKALGAAESYINLLNRDDVDVFSHQSDLKSSVVPEFLYLLFKRLVSSLSLNLEVAAQKQIVIESLFTPRREEPVAQKFKRVDVAILRSCALTIDEALVEDFAMPVVAIENKTNIDKNMISGAEHSVESLKKTFPLCKYYLIGEFADFAVETQNYAATSIDEIFILRKQKRSQVRRGEGVHRIDLDILFELKSEVESHLAYVTNEPVDIKEGMKSGRLVKGE